MIMSTTEADSEIFSMPKWRLIKMNRIARFSLKFGITARKYMNKWHIRFTKITHKQPHIVMEHVE